MAFVDRGARRQERGAAGFALSVDHVDPERLREVVTDAWIARAPKRLAAQFLAADES